MRKQFTGYERDNETELDFAEARYYYNHHGRFTAVDPLLASGKSADPQTFNRYAYTMNRPLSLVDKTGLQAGVVSRNVGKENTFAIKHPLVAADIGENSRLGTNIASVSTRFATNSDFNTRGPNGEVAEINALRHTILSAIITARHGADLAKEATDSHENSGDLPSSQSGSTTFSISDVANQEADLRNNTIGREIGASMEGKSNKEIAKAVLSTFKDKGLNVLQSNKDGTTSVITTTIGQMQYDNTLKNWNNRESNTGFTPGARKEYDEEERKKIEKNLSKSARTASQ